MSSTPALQYRADVVGSLLRPACLKEAMQQAADGAISAAQLGEAQDRAGPEAIALYEATGVDVLTDGEVRRSAWFDPLTQSLAGYTRDAVAPAPFTNTRGTQREIMRLPAVTAPLGLRDNLPLREYEFLRRRTNRRSATIRIDHGRQLDVTIRSADRNRLVPSRRGRGGDDDGDGCSDEDGHARAPAGAYPGTGGTACQSAQPAHGGEIRAAGAVAR